MKLNNTRNTKFHLTIILLIGGLLSSCGLQPEEAPQPNMTEIISAAQTQASGTLQAEIANEEVVNPTAMEEATAAPIFTPLPTIAISIEPTATFPPLPTQSTAPTAIPLSAITTDSSGRPCWRALMQAETIPDGMVLSPGQDETKSWTLQNTGSCKWDQNTKLILIDGAKIFDGFVFDIGNIPVEGISTNQAVRIEVAFFAPSTPGTYRSVFLLRNYTGSSFGLGDHGTDVFWMEIVVD
jgi:hypothetical protein